jgi:hypothetical protein
MTTMATRYAGRNSSRDKASRVASPARQQGTRACTDLIAMHEAAYDVRRPLLSASLPHGTTFSFRQRTGFARAAAGATDATTSATSRGASDDRLVDFCTVCGRARE